MKTRTLRTLLFTGTLAGLTLAATAAPPDAKDYLGRWDILIHEAGDSFASSWLKVIENEGKLTGELVWKWGSVTGISDVRVEDGELLFRRGNESFQAKIDGDELRGVAKMGNREFRFTGRPAPEMCDPLGTWKVTAVGDPDQRAATLVLQEKDGKLTGTATDPDGNSFRIENAKLEGYVLKLDATLARSDGVKRHLVCEIHGDVLVGKVEITMPGEAEARTMELQGERVRKWGEPVKLLAEDGLDGWSSRDPRRQLKWKVSDGVLENGDGDVDIMSAKKFRDFKLHLEYKVNEGSNSGIYLRGRYELQILGDTRIQDHGNMAVYSRLSPAKNPMKAMGDWQSIDVTFIGRWVTVALNGEVVHDNAYLDGITGGAIDPWEGEPGPLLLQGDHGKVWFRNVVVTPVE